MVVMVTEALASDPWEKGKKKKAQIPGTVLELLSQKIKLDR